MIRTPCEAFCLGCSIIITSSISVCAKVGPTTSPSLYTVLVPVALRTQSDNNLRKISVCDLFSDWSYTEFYMIQYLSAERLKSLRLTLADNVLQLVENFVNLSDPSEQRVCILRSSQSCKVLLHRKMKRFTETDFDLRPS